MTYARARPASDPEPTRSGTTEWHYLMAASTLVILPVITLFFFAQRSFIEGIALTGAKA